MPEFYMIIAAKYFPVFFWGGGARASHSPSATLAHLAVVTPLQLTAMHGASGAMAVVIASSAIIINHSSIAASARECRLNPN